MFHFHKWSKFSTPVRHNILQERKGVDCVVGYKYVQHKTCSVCGLVKFKVYKDMV